MRSRPFDIGTQPAGHVHYAEADKGKDGYHGILTCDRLLSAHEVSRYELKRIITKFAIGDKVQTINISLLAWIKWRANEKQSSLTLHRLEEKPAQTTALSTGKPPHVASLQTGSHLKWSGFGPAPADPLRLPDAGGRAGTADVFAPGHRSGL